MKAGQNRSGQISSPDPLFDPNTTDLPWPDPKDYWPDLTLRVMTTDLPWPDHKDHWADLMSPLTSSEMVIMEVRMG